MRKIPSIFSVTQMELLSFFGIFWIVSVGLVYILFTLFLLNYRFVLATLTSSFPISTKFTILFSLLGGLFSALSPIDSSIVIFSALLVGINLLLMTKTLYTLGHSGKVHMSIGGATLLGLISTGCSSCGFSILSLLGLSASLSFLPFHGVELHLLSLLFLLFSGIYMLKKLRDSKYCRIQ